MSDKGKIITTGSDGVIGQILKKGLGNIYQIIGFDLPDCDVRKYDILANVASGCSAIIHLAWDTKIDNFLSETITPDNSQMFLNVYKAAFEEDEKHRLHKRS